MIAICLCHKFTFYKEIRNLQVLKYSESKEIENFTVAHLIIVTSVFGPLVSIDRGASLLTACCKILIDQKPSIV